MAFGPYRSLFANVFLAERAAGVPGPRPERDCVYRGLYSASLPHRAGGRVGDMSAHTTYLHFVRKFLNRLGFSA
jgi:hypothetical protein